MSSPTPAAAFAQKSFPWRNTASGDTEGRQYGPVGSVDRHERTRPARRTLTGTCVAGREGGVGEDDQPYLSPIEREHPVVGTAHPQPPQAHLGRIPYRDPCSCCDDGTVAVHHQAVGVSHLPAQFRQPTIAP